MFRDESLRAVASLKYMLLTVTFRFSRFSKLTLMGQIAKEKKSHLYRQYTSLEVSWIGIFICMKWAECMSPLGLRGRKHLDSLPLSPSLQALHWHELQNTFSIFGAPSGKGSEWVAPVASPEHRGNNTLHPVVTCHPSAVGQSSLEGDLKLRSPAFHSRVCL